MYSRSVQLPSQAGALNSAVKSRFAAPTWGSDVVVRQFVEQVIAGLAAGGIYASLALALVLIYRGAGILNFAQGEFATFTTFIAWTLLVQVRLPYPIALGLAVTAGFVGAFAVERLIVRRFQRSSEHSRVVVTLALFAVVNASAGLIWGYDPRAFPTPFPAKPERIAGILVSAQDAAVLTVSLLVVGLVY